MSHSETLKIRTNLYTNKKYNPAKGLVKGNASPLTTHAGRISVGENGVFWLGNLNAWSVFIDEDREWSSVMSQETSNPCGVVGIILNVLGAMEAIDLNNPEEVAETVSTLFNTTLVVELPGTNSESVTDVYDLVSELPHYIEGSVELSIGIKADGSLSIKGIMNAPEIHKGKLSLVESDRLQIGSAFSSFARSKAPDFSQQRSALKSALKSQRQQNNERKEKFSKKTAVPVATESNSAGVEIPNDSALPPAI